MAKLRVMLSAEPLAMPTDYVYQLHLSSEDERGVTLIEVAKQTGLGSTVETLGNSFPIAQDVVGKIKLISVGITLHRAKGKTTMNNFLFDVSVDDFVVFEKLSIKKAKANLSYNSVLWDGRLSGDLSIGDRKASVDINLPVDGIPGTYLTTDTTHKVQANRRG